jgi:hypothetical protein
MRKSELLAALKKEIQRHNLSTFIDTPPSTAQGGRGVVVTGCRSAGSSSARSRSLWII